MQITEALCYDDVLLRPTFFSGKSRRDIDLKTSIAGLKLDVPIISANMPCVASYDMAIAMNKLGGLCILDRMTSDQDIHIKLFREETDGLGKIGASIGIQGTDEELMDEVNELINVGASIICIDVAHGAQARTFEVIRLIRKTHKQFPLMVGNFADFEGSGLRRQDFRLLDDYYTCWKLGVGSGAACSTRIKTGCGLPTFQSLIDWKSQSDASGFYAPHVIADGGIKNSGDIVKSLAAGARAVMLGSLLAGSDESGGETIKDDKTGNRYKIYRGNASSGSKIAAGLKSEFIEGVESLVKCKGPVESIIKDLIEGVKSGLSYCGSRDLQELRLNANFVKVSSSGHHESKPHGIF